MTKVILITGASSGIGYETALKLAEAGYRVFGTSRRQIQSAHENITMLQLDLARIDSIDSFVSQLNMKTKIVDVLINNAGLGTISSIEKLSSYDIDKIIATNCVGPIYLIQKIIPLMRHQLNGKIINISSLGSIHGLPYRGLYSASKAFLNRITEALYFELPSNIQICKILLGSVNTRIYENWLSRQNANGSQTSNSKVEKCFEDRIHRGKDPISVAEFIYKISQKKKIKSSYVFSQLDERILPLLSRVLPSTALDKFVKWYFNRAINSTKMLD